MKYLKLFEELHKPFSGITYKKETRSTEINADDAVKFFKENCEWDLDLSNYQIYRGTNTNFEYGFVDPSKHDRVASNSNQTYLNWFGGNPAWSEYPNRNKSLICSTDEHRASVFPFSFRIVGDDNKNVYCVIPIKETKIGICPEKDFQDSFNEFDKIFDTPIFDFWRLFDIEQRDVLSYDEVVKRILSKDLSEYHQEQFQWDSGEDALKILKDSTDPVKNGFSIRKAKDFQKHFDDEVEVWMSGPCLLIRQDMMDEFKKMVGN